MGKLLILTAVLLCLFSCTDDLQASETYPEPPEVPQAADFHRVIHAGGVLWGCDEFGNYTSFKGSNSLEGLEQCVNAGITTVELDFCFTEDGYLACIHNWSPIFIDNITTDQPMTLEEFLDSKIYGNFTPMSLDEVAQFLREHEEMTVVTDIKDNFPEAVKLIAETKMTDRFVVQIYHEEEYEIVSEYGFEKIIYTLYKLDWDEKTDTEAISDFAETHPLTGIAFDKALCTEIGYVEKMKEIGVPLFVHTVNEDEEMYLEMGISGIYTDVLK